MKMDNRFTAEQAMAHGAAIQKCLNGALVAVKDIHGKWSPFSGNWQSQAFSSYFSYRTKRNECAPVIESPATSDGVTERSVPHPYSGTSFSVKQIKAHGAVIQYFLRGGSIQYRANDDCPWGAATSGGCFAFVPSHQYRIAEEACKCEICTEPLPAGWTIEPKVKPPLGVESEYIWVSKRIDALAAACARQITQPGIDQTDWRLVANWSAEILERKEQLEGINRRPKAA